MDAPAVTKADLVRKLILETLPPGLDGSGRIFGGEAALDSLGLVNFLADLEYRLAEEFGHEVVLASERAMSRHGSPFRDVSTLTEYAVELLGR